MNWWQLLILWLGSWLTIIILNIINRAIEGDPFITEGIENELVADGNNLFTSGLFYFIGNLACNFIDWPVLHWILFIVGVLFCILPIISLFKMLANLFGLVRKYVLSFIGAVISQVIPLIMAINIYLVYIN